MAVVATGFFDGVHLGHRSVIDTLLSEARRRGEQSVIVTFWPHPRTVLQDDARSLRLLNSLGEKKALLLGLGVDRVEVLDFSRNLSRLTAEQYLRDVLVSKLGATAVVLGYDNRFGSDGLSRPALVTLAEGLGLNVIECEAKSSQCGSSPLKTSDSVGPLPSDDGPLPLMLPRVAQFSEGTAASAETRPISSTRIRKALEAGDVEGAGAMLGYRYMLHGVVVAGNRLGRTIGFPTANMQLYEPLKLVPANGVYFVEVETLGGHFLGMTNIGVKPTVTGAGVRTIETHIFDFDELIYGLDITVRFIARVRDERKFASLDELRGQLEADRELCREMGRKNPREALNQ